MRYASEPFDENKHPVNDVQLTGSNIPEAQAIPYQIVKRKQTTIQTHNAVSIAAGAISIGSWIDCNGFDKLAITLLNDATTSSQVHVYWSNDGVNNQGYDEAVVANNTISLKAGITDVKARYARLYVHNGDTVAHTMSAWAYLKC